MKATIYLIEGGKRVFATVKDPDEITRKDGFVCFNDGRGRVHRIPDNQVLRVEIIDDAGAVLSA